MAIKRLTDHLINEDKHEQIPQIAGVDLDNALSSSPQLW
jgi:hypothetical protein